MIGILHRQQPLMLHRKIGDATDDKTRVTLLVLAHEPLGTPLIVHQDGRTFELPWSDIIKLADDAFLEDELEQFTRGYKAALLWSSTVGPEGEEESADNFHMTEQAEAQCKKDCRDFFGVNKADVRLAANAYKVERGTGFSHAGQDFALTRNGHGAGFWDGDLPKELGERLTTASKAHGEVNLYLNEDEEVDIL